jgi:hypothetical protein
VFGGYQDSWKEQGFFLCHNVQTSCGILLNGYQGLFLGGVKQLGHEADHSSPSSAKVKNMWSYISTSSCVVIVWCLIKHRMSSWHSTLSCAGRTLCLPLSVS